MDPKATATTAASIPDAAALSAREAESSGCPEDPRLFIYQLDQHERIVDVNRHWLDFAQENGAEWLTRSAVIGKRLWDFVSGPETCAIYEILFSRARSQRRIVRVPFRCDSPTERRFMEMQIVPAHNANLLIVNRIERFEARPAINPPAIAGLLRLCSWCKRVQLPSRDWAEIEVAAEVFGAALTSTPPQLSHGICPECRDAWVSDLSIGKLA